MKSILLAFFLFFSIGNLISAQTNMWTDIPENQIVLIGARYIIPSAYRTIKLNINLARTILKSAPMEFTPEAKEAKFTIELPMPDGSLLGIIHYGEGTSS